MITIHDRPTRLCDRITRRELLRIGGLSTLGLSLPSLLQAREEPPAGIINDPTFGRAKNIIYLWLQGGPPQHETFDPKPEAPAEIRGPFKPIATNVPGIHFCELLPRTARMADKLAVVRSLSTDNNLHDGSGYEVLTGYKYQGSNSRVISPTDWPYFGSIVKMLKPSEVLPPLSTVWLPDIMRLNENVTPAGQTGGFLGRQWDPDRFVGDPSQSGYKVEGLGMNDVPPLRLQRRISLLQQVERHFDRLERGRAVGAYDQYQQQAFDLLTTNRVRDAFAIHKEPDKLRDRYGRTTWGQCVLLARRLIEVGVRLVHVNWAREPGDSAVDNPMWDTHAQNADRLEDVLCPIFDVSFTALLEDLDQRGLLSETLVIAIGEFGRTPQINASGGRDHWGPVFSFAMAGAGIAGGQVYGASDQNGAYPARDRVSGGDLTATLFHLLGVDHRATFKDPERREHRITMGEPIRKLLGTEPATLARTEPGGDIARLPAFDTSLLLNVDFTAPVPLRPADFGSRPKGWRADPLVTDAAPDAFGVILIGQPPSESQDSDLATPARGVRRHVAIGFGTGESAVEIAPKAQVLLAQEMRNPRAGRFTFTIQASGGGSSREFYENVFLKHFTCRLVLFRYANPAKNPTQRHELGSVTFQPRFADPATENEPEKEKEQYSGETFEISQPLDSAAPGQNFSIGAGLGVAIVVEKTSPDVLALPTAAMPQSAYLRIDRAELNFRSRTINDDVTV